MSPVTIISNKGWGINTITEKYWALAMRLWLIPKYGYSKIEMHAAYYTNLTLNKYIIGLREKG